MKKITLFTISFSFCLMIFAQTDDVADTTRAKEILNHARKLWDQGDQAGVIRAYEEAGEIYKQSEIWDSYTEMKFRVADIYRLQGNYYQATGLLEQTWAEAGDKFNETDPMTAAYYAMYSAIYMEMGLYEKAEAAIYKAIDIRERFPEPKTVDLAGAYINLGVFLNSKGFFDQAISWYEKGIQMLKDIGMENYPFVAFGYLNIGNAWQAIGDYERAILYYENALNHSAKSLSPIHPFRVAVLNSMGTTADANGNYAQAETYFDEGLALAEQIFGPEHLQIVEIWLNKGAMQEEIGDLQKARENFQVALQISEKILPPTHEDLILTYENSGIIEGKLGNYESAIDLISKAINQQKSSQGEKNAGLASLYLKAGNVLKRQEKYDDALKMYQKGLTALPGLRIEGDQMDITQCEGGELPVLSQLLFASGTTLETAGSSDRALEYLVTAIQATNRLRTRYSGLKTRVRNRETSADLYANAIRIAEKLYRETGESDYMDQAFGFSTQSKAALLQETLADHQARQFAGIPEAITIQENYLKNNISFYENELAGLRGTPQDSAKKQEWNTQLLRFQNTYDSLMAAISNQFPNYYQLKYQSATTGIRDIQKSLPGSSTAVVEYFITDSIGYVFLVSSREAKMFTLQLPEELSAWINELRERVQPSGLVAGQSGKEESFIQAAAALYDLLISPMEDLLKQESITELVIIPDGALHYLSFEMLIQQSREKDFRALPYLIRDYAISYAYSSDIWIRERQPANWEYEYAGFAPEYQADYLAYAAELNDYGNYRDAITNLAFSKEEILQAASFFDGKTFTDESATETAFRKYGTRARILHLAMHAIADDLHPMRSKLLFSSSDTLEDGFLNAYELYNLPLNAELAVLSACNTGYGQLARGEGVMSLSRAFSFAGCQAIIMSIWAADDRSTSEIMNSFYQNLSNGMPKNTALQQAKLAFLKEADGLTAHPYFWAGLVATGNMEPLQENKNWWWLILVGVVVFVGGIVWWRGRGGE